jgi:soluble lytic murein transglycosylase-like protein
MERFPLTYYAALSWHQLESLGVDPATVTHQPILAVPMTPERVEDLSKTMIPAHPRVRRGLELWRTGRAQEAKRALWAQLQFRDPPRGVVQLLATFHLIDGDTHASFWLASKHGDFSVAPYDGNAHLWSLSYPAPSKLLKVAVEVGEELKADPLLAMAIIRHESGFRSDVVSSAGARGLMQVMPGSAKEVRRVWYGGRGPRNLRKDSDNIRLGMTLVQMHHNYFAQNLPLIIGGYNAGSGTAERWWKKFGHLETDEFVEQMTYPRTVAYVKKVIGSNYAYRVLYGDGQPPEIALKLPASLGSWWPARPRGAKGR